MALVALLPGFPYMEAYESKLLSNQTTSQPTPCKASDYAERPLSLLGSNAGTDLLSFPPILEMS